MKVDHVLILAAGKGTRMGAIGKHIPKVLWPVYELSLLELEILYAKNNFPGAKIYINLFNYKKNIQDYAVDKIIFNDVHFIEEDEVLDIGGAIHNLANILGYEGTLATLNSDQFLMLNKSLINKKLKEEVENNDMVLFTYEVATKQGYNGLDIKESFLHGIIPNSQLETEVTRTYTGMSLINLSCLKKVGGESKYFDTVANWNEYTIRCVNINDFEYWDFGTVERYYDSIINVIDPKFKNSMFYQFLNSVNGIDEKKIDGKSYHSDNGINFTSQFRKINNGSILFSGFEDLKLEKKVISWNGIQNILEI